MLILRDKTKKILLCVLLLLVAAGLLLTRFVSPSGIREFNRYSVTDFGLGERVDGIDSADDLADPPSGYEAFTDDRGSGLKSTRSDTRYYFGEHGGRYCVTGFVSHDIHCSALSISVGDDELASRTLLLEDGYHVTQGGYDRSTLSNGTVSVELGFTRGIVTSVAAFIL